MSDDADPPSLSVEEVASALSVDDVLQLLGELEARVQSLEGTVATLQDTRQLEERITAKVAAQLPKAPPPDHAGPPTLSDITIPMPDVNTLLNAAKNTWMVIELLVELKTLLWMLVDRRYHMAWFTRFWAMVLLVMILTSQWWFPLAFDNLVGHFLEKLLNLFLGLIMFLTLHYEMGRYRTWLKKR